MFKNLGDRLKSFLNLIAKNCNEEYLLEAQLQLDQAQLNVVNAQIFLGIKLLSEVDVDRVQDQ